MALRCGSCSANLQSVFFVARGLYYCGLGMRRCCSANTGNLEHQWSIQNQTSVCTLSCWSDLLLNTLIPNPQTPNKKKHKAKLKGTDKVTSIPVHFFFVQMKIFLTHKWISQNCNSHFSLKILWFLIKHTFASKKILFSTKGEKVTVIKAASQKEIVSGAISPSQKVFEFLQIVGACYKKNTSLGLQ